MAGQYDGSIRINTRIDKSGFNEGTRSITKGVSSLKSELASLGSTIAATFSVATIVAFSKKSSDLAISTEASIQRLVDNYGEASQAVGDFIDNNAMALGMSKASATAFASVYGNLFSVWADGVTNAELTNQYLNMTAVVASKTGRTVSDVQERVRSGLLGNTEAIEDLGIFVNIKTIEITDAFKRMANGRSWEQLDAYTQQQIRTMAILEQATKKYGSEVAQTSALTRSQFHAAYEDFQNTWGQVVNTVLLPILKVGTMVLNVLTKGLQTIAHLSGKTLDNTNEQTTSINSSVGAQNDLTDAVKETEKAQKGALAGFDEINTLTKDTAKNSKGGIGGGLDDLGIKKSDVSLDGSKVVSEVDSTLTSVMAIVGMSLAAIGVILLCTGHLGWGIGFIIAGAALFAVTMATLRDNSISQKVKDGLSTAVILAGITAVAIGILLCMAQKWGLGIGLIIIGVTSLVTAVVLNPDGVKNLIVNFFQKNGAIIAGISISMLVMGVILLMGGVINPISIGMVIMGAAGLVTAIALNWNSITNAVKGFFQENAGLIAGVSTALLVLGVILIITGVGIPVGIGLILAGTTGLAATVALNWNFITDKVKSTWESIKAYWRQNIAKYFTAEWWGNLGKTAINGLIRWVINGFNKLIGKINSFGFEMPEVLGGGRVGFNISYLKIPQLAKGAVIPPNRKFLAVLGDQKNGTNIEAPLDTIKQAVAEVNSQFKFGGGLQNTRIEIPLIIGGREITRVIREAENEMGTQTVFGGFQNAY